MGVGAAIDAALCGGRKETLIPDRWYCVMFSETARNACVTFAPS